MTLQLLHLGCLADVQVSLIVIVGMWSVLVLQMEKTRSLRKAGESQILILNPSATGSRTFG